MTDVRIGPDKEVTLHFALKLDNGDVVDSTFDKNPATFKVGDGNLLPGFEQAIYGLKAGDKRSLEISPEQGFGQGNPQNIQVMPRSQGEPRPVSDPSSDSASAKPMLMPAPIEAASPTRKV